MAIDTISPVADSQLDPGDAFSFRVDDTYTTITVEVETAGGWEYAYDSSLSGAQAGYTVSVVDLGSRHEFTVTRTAGWNLSPFSIRVVENETGSEATTTTNYTLYSAVTHPQSSDPYFLQSLGDSFLAHSDTPSTYSGQGGKAVLVKGTEDGLEFALGGSTDANAIHDNVANEISALTEKVTPADDDLIIIEDSAASYVKKKVKKSALGGGGTWGSITGTITDQTDLASYVTAGTTARDALYLTERADHVNTPAAGSAELWVNNATKQDLIFTDDGGSDRNVLTLRTATKLGNNAIPVGYGTEGTCDFSTLFSWTGSTLTLGQTAGSNIKFLEAASISAAPGANYGALWIKNDTPNAPMFTDDAASDFRVLRQLDSETWQSTALLRAYGGEDGRVFVESNLRYNSGLGQLQMYDANANIRMKEGTAPTGAASYGHIWVKNDAPNTAQFTDDASNTYELGDRVHRIWYPMRGANTTTSIYLRNPSWQPNTYQSWSTNGGSTQGSLAAPAFTYGFPVVPFDGYITRIFGSLRYWGTSGSGTYITDCELWKWSGADEATAFSGSEVAGSGGYLEISDTTTGTSSSGIQIYNFDLTISSNNAVSKGDMIEAVFWNQTTNVSGYPHVSQIIEITRTNVPST